MQIINCTYRGSRATYYVSKPYPYYATDEVVVGMAALEGTLKEGVIVIPDEAVVLGMLPLTSELRTLLQTYNASTGATDGSTAANASNVEVVLVSLVPLASELRPLLSTHIQPIEDKVSAALTARDGTLLQVLVTHSQPIEAANVTLTALNGTLV